MCVGNVGCLCGTSIFEHHDKIPPHERAFPALPPPIQAVKMSLRKGPVSTQYNDAPSRLPPEDSDAEEDAMVQDYKEQVQYDDELNELERTGSFSFAGGPQELQAQLSAAATPLEYNAPLDIKIQSYDSFCAMFHFILNSEGPLDIEIPSVCLDKYFYMVRN